MLAGTVNEAGPLRCEATAVGQSTLLAAIVRQVAAAQGSKAPVQRLADQRLRALRAGGARDRRGDADRERRPAGRLVRGADARDRRARDRVSVRARTRDADGADGRRRPGRAGGHPDQERRGAGARGEDRHARRRQDRHADGGAPTVVAVHPAAGFTATRAAAARDEPRAGRVASARPRDRPARRRRSSCGRCRSTTFASTRVAGSAARTARRRSGSARRRFSPSPAWRSTRRTSRGREGRGADDRRRRRRSEARRLGHARRRAAPERRGGSRRAAGRPASR